MANNTKTITMSMRELDRFKVIQDVADGKLKPWRAAERLGLSVRQVERPVISHREREPGGVASGRRGRARCPVTDAAPRNQGCAVRPDSIPEIQNRLIATQRHRGRQ